ncbi:hypothetical protein TruAng_010422 [Truncatella angustata]|nr:hypothetical protein TruAng_010422 [Truncatella angustata]
MSSQKEQAQTTTTSAASERSSLPTRPVGERCGYAHMGTDWDLKNTESANKEKPEGSTKKSWKSRLFKGPGLGIYG